MYTLGMLHAEASQQHESEQSTKGRAGQGSTLGGKSNSTWVDLRFMVARISGEGVPVMAWIFSIWSISFVPGNSGNKLTTCTAQQQCSQSRNVVMLL